MNEQLIRSFLTVMVNDMAYLYALVQELTERVGHLGQGRTDEKMFEQWQDDWKQSFVEMVEDLSTELGMDEFLELLEEE